MGIPTYEYPPKKYPMTAKYESNGKCTYCGELIEESDNYMCKKCKSKVHAGVSVNKNVYFHGDRNSNQQLLHQTSIDETSAYHDTHNSLKEKLTKQSKFKSDDDHDHNSNNNNNRNLISVYVYPPKMFPMKAHYKQRNGICVHCKSNVKNTNKVAKCLNCNIELCCGIEYKSKVYYHGKTKFLDRSESNLHHSQYSIHADNNLMISAIIDVDNDSINHINYKNSNCYFCNQNTCCSIRQCIIGLLILIIIICILIIIFVFLLKSSF